MIKNAKELMQLWDRPLPPGNATAVQMLVEATAQEWRGRLEKVNLKARSEQDDQIRSTSGSYLEALGKDPFGLELWAQIVRDLPILEKEVGLVALPSAP